MPDLSIGLSGCTCAGARPVMDAVARLMAPLGVSIDFLVISLDREDASPEPIEGCRVEKLKETSPALGDQLRAFRDASHSTWLITLEDPVPADASLVFGFWHRRNTSDLLVASRYTQGGSHQMPWLRTVLSRSLNSLYRFGLAVDIRDLSSARRMYRADLLRQIDIQGHDADILMETLLKYMALGVRPVEVPWHYASRRSRQTVKNTLRLVRSSLTTFWRMHSLRNSVDFPDYDSRAYDSRIWLQRYWQRSRFRIIREFVDDNAFTLDAGCGSSRIITTRPDMLAMDINIHRLRYLRPSNPRRLQATAGALPFADDTFDAVISSQVIEHTRETTCISEAARVLRPGGTLVVGTPDYATFWWPVTERIYGIVKSGGYADEHVTHYTRESLTQAITSCDCEVLDYRYIGGGELIIRARKKGGTERPKR